MSFPYLDLKQWFLKAKRDLPWRKTTDPYKIWISEIMLQQTQVQTVLFFYNRWLSLFPTVEILARSPIEEVLKAWEGLGYYSRARNIHKSAQIIVNQYNSKFPSEENEILKLKGIGPYTKGAILSFAFRKKSPLIDGNIKRVFTRVFLLRIDLSESSSYKQLEKLSEELLPNQEPWIFNEALMELGALICTPQNPKCHICPLKKSCRAYLEDDPAKYPIKSKKVKPIALHRIILGLKYNDCFLIKKQTKALMKDLYEFPYLEMDFQPTSKEEIERAIEIFLKMDNLRMASYPTILQSFTKYRVTLYPFLIELSEKSSISPFDWISKSELEKKPLSSGHRKFFRIISM